MTGSEPPADHLVGPPEPAPHADEEPRGLSRVTIVQSFWSALGTLAQFLTSFVTLVVLARLLDADDFGVVGLGITVFALAETLSYKSLGPGVVRSPTLDEDHVRVAYTLSLALGLGMAALVVAVIAPVAASFFHTEELTSVVRVLAIILVLRALSTVAEALLERDLQFRRLATVQAVSNVVGYGLVAIGLAAAGLGLWALVWAQVAQAVIETGMLLYMKRHGCRPRFERQIAGDLMSYSTGHAFSRISNNIAANGDNIVIGRFLGPMALGFYSRAYRLMSLPANLLSDAIESVLLSTMARVQTDHARLRLAFLRGNSLPALVILPMSAVAIVLAPEIVAVVLGDTWASVVAPFQILALAMFFRAGRKAAGSVARATGAVFRLGSIHALYAGLVLVGSWALVSHGITGVAWAVCGALTVNFVLVTRLTARLIGVGPGPIVRSLAPGTFLGIAVGLVVWGSSELLRSSHQADLVVLLAGLAVAGVAALALTQLLPGVFLGPEGRWWSTQVRSWIPRRSRTAEVPAAD
jgi:O-antigen/teichoic acid export membrane protein